MLGFSAVSARPISAGPFSLIGYAAAITASIAITFSGSATWGAMIRGSATARIVFGGSATWSSLNALTASGGLVFNGSGPLRLAGKPIVFYAVPERLTFVGLPERYSFTARADNFTFRGMR